MGLKEIRDKLAETIGDAWEKQKEFRDKFKDLWTNDMREAYEEAMTKQRDPIKGLREAAEKIDLDEKYRDLWKEAPDDLMEALYGVRDIWSTKERDEVSKIVREAGISELYKLCMYGKFDEVKRRLGLKEAPSNFADCARAVAEAKKLSEKLKAAWGKE